MTNAAEGRSCIHRRQWHEHCASCIEDDLREQRAKVQAQRDRSEITTLREQLAAAEALAADAIAGVDEQRARAEAAEKRAKEAEGRNSYLGRKGLADALRIEELERALRDASATLHGIAEAARFDREVFESDSEFVDWAQSRARHEAGKIAPLLARPGGEETTTPGEKEGRDA